ncbi:hypothetical protein NPIL_159001 [Nephila pilipes]|uniref:Uncharacterized protein n=1 Tax=Nephila pilipes TaxID=299642 RepID=A0A8X6PVC0_NEPPI|nr:hypothetical protein NPIL_159001 [Nephila pilipes]
MPCTFDSVGVNVGNSWRSPNREIISPEIEAWISKMSTNLRSFGSDFNLKKQKTVSKHKIRYVCRVERLNNLDLCEKPSRTQNNVSTNQDRFGTSE